MALERDRRNDVASASGKPTTSSSATCVGVTVMASCIAQCSKPPPTSTRRFFTERFSMPACSVHGRSNATSAESPSWLARSNTGVDGRRVEMVAEDRMYTGSWNAAPKCHAGFGMNCTPTWPVGAMIGPTLSCPPTSQFGSSGAQKKRSGRQPENVTWLLNVPTSAPAVRPMRHSFDGANAAPAPTNASTEPSSVTSGSAAARNLPFTVSGSS